MYFIAYCDMRIDATVSVAAVGWRVRADASSHKSHCHVMTI
jgi:hypothetical protein